VISSGKLKILKKKKMPFPGEIFSPKIRTWTSMPLKRHIIGTFKKLVTDTSEKT
jgi:hypothetical protein